MKIKKCMLVNPAPKGRILTLRCIISTESYSQTFGSLYPIQIYISKCTFPNPAPKGFTETLQLTCIYPIVISNIYFVISIFVFRFKENMSIVCIYWYWIYHTNNWGKCVSWRVSVRPGMYIF